MIYLKKVYFFLLDILQTLILAAAAFVVVYMFLFRPFEVNGESMYPTYHNGEYLITNIISLRFSDPELGEVVVFKAPNDPDKDFIKRIIGVAGDRVKVEDGNVFVNGNALDEEVYVSDEISTYGGTFLTEGNEVVVPEGHFFVLGDNRPFSSDSREWGFVPKKNIVGVSTVVYWPLNAAGIVKNPY